MVIHEFYILTLVVFVALLLFMGIYLFFGVCPEELKRSSYSWSRKATGLAFVWLAMEIIAFAVFDIRESDVALSSMLNLITYYIFVLFVSSAYIRLLDEEATMSRAKVARELILWYVYASVLAFFVLKVGGVAANVALVIAAISLFAKAFEVFLRVIKVYEKAIERSQNYHSENIEPIIKWVKKSAYMFLAVCITSLFTAFSHKLLIVMNILFTMSVFIYVFVNYINVMVRFTVIKERDGLVDDVGLIPHEDSDNVLKPEVSQQIKAEIDKWIENRGYVEAEVSIKSLASVACTNRTYLSQYINKVYRLPFRDWIISLRVIYAKQIMTEQPKLTVAVVAQMVGFSSSATFTRAFTRQELISPVKWKECNLPPLVLDCNTDS
ncbi:MAG: helix-turn-helix domain-containing protein [Rikenellaceae bacterium]